MRTNPSTHNLSVCRVTGKYNDVRGGLCQDCPDKSSTLFEGAVSRGDCVCRDRYGTPDIFTYEECTPMCPVLSTVLSPNARILGGVNPAGAYVHPFEVQIECSNGFMVGTDMATCAQRTTLQCGLTGLWGPYRPQSVCTQITCPLPAEPNALPFEAPTALYQIPVPVKCKEGWGLADPSNNLRVCSTGCKLEPWENMCVANQCEEFPTLKNVEVSAVFLRQEVFGNNITQRCEKGFYLRGSQCARSFYPECKADGKFTMIPQLGDPDLCIPASCPAFFSVEPEVKPTALTTMPVPWGTKTRVYCSDGFRSISRRGGEPCGYPDNSFDVACGEGDGEYDSCEWKRECECKPVFCGFYEPPPNSTVDDPDWKPSRNYRIDDWVNMKCNTGFMIADMLGAACDTERKVYCMRDGAFTPFQCIPQVQN
jgi:hypothetical protein